MPVATTYDAGQILADPHFAARGDIVVVDDPVVGPIRQQAPFPRYVGEVPTTPAGAPRLGEHTREVLHTLLDLPDSELDRLSESGIIS